MILRANLKTSQRLSDILLQAAHLYRFQCRQKGQYGGHLCYHTTNNNWRTWQVCDLQPVLGILQNVHLSRQNALEE